MIVLSPSFKGTSAEKLPLLSTIVVKPLIEMLFELSVEPETLIFLSPPLI